MIGLKKTGNILKASASYLCSALMHRPLTWGMPFFYSIEPINLCNLHCPECPSGNGSMRRKRGMISMEDYCRIIDRIAPYAVHLTLYFQGEPLLHPQFPEKGAVSISLLLSRKPIIGSSIPLPTIIKVLLLDQKFILERFFVGISSTVTHVWFS